MNLLILRGDSTNLGTLGKALLDNHGSFDTLELPWRDNKPQLSCIKAGFYTATVQWSNHFQANLYHLNDTNDRHDVEIHNGNFAGDVTLGYKSHVLGCILMGHGYGQIDRGDGSTQFGILHSRETLSEFMSATCGKTLNIEIRWVGESPE